jgi:protein-disulfide isomerase
LVTLDVVVKLLEASKRQGKYQAVLELTALKVTKTPTFFVNGRSLPSFGPDQLAALVAEEVAKVRK